MPNRILRDWTDQINEIDSELKSMPMLNYRNPEHGRMSIRKWELYCKKRRIRMLIAKTKGDHTDSEWVEMLKQKNYTCAICGTSGAISKDHIIPISKGGSNSLDNIQVLCGSCNSAKGNRQ